MAYTALYNLYRPHAFSEVIGQKAVVTALSNQVDTQRISHAYLFSGPRGIGKTSLARIFAKAINCIAPEKGEACKKCAICKMLSEKNNLDIIEIDAASNTSVNDIRTLRENVIYMPVVGKYRIYIIDEVHMLSVNAFNALLKTLEEPPEHIVFIMATTEPHKLPVTVLSRCQRYEFTRISTPLITAYLEELVVKLKVKADKKALVAIARASAGGMRDALSLLDQMLAMGKDNIDVSLVSQMLGSADKLLYFALCDSILKEEFARAIKGLHYMIEKGCSASTIATDLMQMFRDLYIAQKSKNIGEDLMTDDATAQRYIMIAQSVSSGAVLQCLELFSTLENDLRYAARPEIWLELAVAKACRVQKEQSYDALIKRIERLEKRLENANQNVISNKSQAQAPQEEFFPVKDADFEKTTLIEEKESIKEDAIIPCDKEEKLDEKTDIPTVDEDITVSTIQETAIGIEDKITTQDIDEGKKIWSKAIDEIRTQKKMRLTTAMKKATVTGYGGNILRIGFDVSDNASADRFADKELSEILKKALKKITDKNIIVDVKIIKLNADEDSFMQEVYSAFPKGLVSVEHEE
ncbi:MAG: DNA polymerase III subunit gamma/tau [Clostridiales bacterium]|nr:DNA polymerase III subunit gamma/tau [Clostridiales bacterium]